MYLSNKCYKIKPSMEALWLEPASNFLLRLNAFGVHDFDDRRFGIIKK